MTTDLRIQLLAGEAVEKIKALTESDYAQIEAIYQEFRTRANAIPAQLMTTPTPQEVEARITGIEAAAKSIGDAPAAGSISQPEAQTNESEIF